MRGLGNDHVISGPIRGLQKNSSDGAHRHTDRHCDSTTEKAWWADSMKTVNDRLTK